MNTKKKVIYLSALAGTVLLLQLFTNCGKIAASRYGSSDKASNSPGGAMTTTQSNVTVGNLSGLTQITGQCSTAAGNVEISGPNAAACQAECKNGLFQVCTVLSGLGNNQITIKQSAISILLTAYTEHPVSLNPGLQFTTVVVNNSSTGTITIDCTPGSSLSSTIYGSEQLPPEYKTCPTEGKRTYTVGLVPSLAGTGQRVVYVTQITQSGTVTTIFVDVDQVVKTHTCSISYGQDSESLCAGQAGTVSGSCKGGSPVQIKVNDVVQQVVPCKENNSYSADNVVLSKPGSNKISIHQKSAFNTTCTAEKSASAFGQLQ
jgi:hypothetical protein